MASLSNKCVRLNPVRCDCGPVSQYQIKEIPGKERPGIDPTKLVGAGFTKPICGANPYYESPFVFDNDFPALLEDVPESKEPNIGSSQILREELAESSASAKRQTFHCH